MANVHVIYDEGGVAEVQIREGKFGPTVYRLLKPIADARAIVRGADIPIRSRNLDVQKRQDIANEILASERFTPEQKDEWYTLLSGRVFAIDYYSYEFVAGHYKATHPTVVHDAGGPVRATRINPLIDP